MSNYYFKLRYLNYLLSKFPKMNNIGLIIIGNEILNGQVQDENSFYIAKRVPILGFKLKEVSIIPDEIDIISQHVLKFSQKYNYVITSGGIGTTHDDVTFEGVAKAFNEQVEQHEKLTAELVKFFNLTGDAIRTNSKLKLARIPKSAELIFGTDPESGNKIPYPVVCSHNVFILPGVPTLFRKSFDIIKNMLRGEAIPLHTKALYFGTEESDLTDLLNIVVKEFSDSVLFGSYPVLNNNFYKVKITMESQNEEKLELASQRLKSAIGPENLSNYDPLVFVNASKAVYEAASRCPKIQSALDTIEEAFRIYQSEELVLAFTGGKDCTVLLHLIYAWLQHTHGTDFSMIRVLFVRTRPSFYELDAFIRSSLRQYRVVPPNSRFLEYNGSMKTSLARLKLDHDEIRAVFMGTKRNDPNGNQTTFSHTTEGWPEFGLINPILDWTYAEIWQFLRQLSVPYCCLYDRGYTSLGGVDNTLPNPKLLFADPNTGKLDYRPAFLLTEDNAERIGRENPSSTQNV